MPRKRQPRRVIDALYRSPWAILPEWLHTLADLAQRDAPPWAGHLAPQREAMLARAGKPMNGMRAATMIDGVAVIPMVGPLFPRANMLTEMSGATSLDMGAADLDAAVASAEVKAILLDVDSPGGVISGVNEFAGKVRAAAAAKPVHAYVGGMAASAAYWIASAASEIVVEESAMLGSIGVVMAAEVQEGLDRDGYRRFDVVSSGAPNKRPDLKTDEGIGVYRAELDALESIFVAAVAGNRKVSEAKVFADFGAGGLLIGAAAVDAGMADRVGTFETALAGMRRPAQAPSMTSMPSPVAAAGWRASPRSSRR